MIRRFFSYYKPHKRLFFIDFSSAIVVAVLELAFPLVVQWFIDTLIPGGDWLENRLGKHRPLTDLPAQHRSAVHCQLSRA